MLNRLETDEDVSLDEAVAAGSFSPREPVRRLSRRPAMRVSGPRQVGFVKSIPLARLGLTSSLQKLPADRREPAPLPEAQGRPGSV